MDKKEEGVSGVEYSKIRPLKYFLSIVILIIITGLSVYFFAPKKKSFQLYPREVINSQLACETIAGVTLFPKRNYNDKTFETVDAEIHNKGSKLAIEFDNEKLKLLTDTSVGIGVAEPAEMAIVRQDTDSVQAVYLEEGLVDPGINTFVLNKKSGFAVWTKSKPAFFGNKDPDTQAYYLECH